MSECEAPATSVGLELSASSSLFLSPENDLSIPSLTLFLPVPELSFALSLRPQAYAALSKNLCRILPESHPRFTLFAFSARSGYFCNNLPGI